MIIGKAWLIYWPPQEIGLVQHQEGTIISAEVANAAAPTPTLTPPQVSVVVESADAPAAEAQPIPQPPTPTSQSMIGSQVKVANTDGVGLAVRIAPGLAEEALFLAEEAETYVIENGPEDHDGHTWWYIADPNDPARAGWSAGEYLERVP
jgi:hypothetical protein